MSIAATASQFVDVFNRFFSNKPEDFLTSGPTFSDFAGPNPDDSLSQLKFVRSTFETLFASGDINLLSHSALNSLISQIQNVNNTYSQFAAGGGQLEAQRLAIATELEQLIKNNAEVEQLKKDVRTLITPAVAGSLSEAFRLRRDKIYHGRLIWLVACLLLGGYASYATFDFVHVVSVAIVTSASQAVANTNLTVWSLIAVRVAVLFPLFAAFGFAFAQYKKERDFEEEYAHKAAVANSLPNYGDLAREQSVRDQIVTAATTVIFTSPTEQARNLENSGAMLSSMKEVVETMGKALGRK